MALDITIRPLSEDDQIQWRRMWTAYLDFYETSVTEEVFKRNSWLVLFLCQHF